MRQVMELENKINLHHEYSTSEELGNGINSVLKVTQLIPFPDSVCLVLALNWVYVPDRTPIL